jgi:hypothetical protein
LFNCWIVHVGRTRIELLRKSGRGRKEGQAAS